MLLLQWHFILAGEGSCRTTVDLNIRKQINFKSDLQRFADLQRGQQDKGGKFEVIELMQKVEQSLSDVLGQILMGKRMIVA